MSSGLSIRLESQAQTPTLFLMVNVPEVSNNNTVIVTPHSATAGTLSGGQAAISAGGETYVHAQRTALDDHGSG